MDHIFIKIRICRKATQEKRNVHVTMTLIYLKLYSRM